MYVYRGDTPEEPVTSSGYIFRFNDLTITSLLLDDLFAVPEEPTRDFLVVHEVRSLRDTRTLLLRNTLRDCISFVEDNAHPRLWKILAETAIDRLDLAVAEKAFVARSDYPGIQFVKRLRLLGDRAKQRAEVLASFNRIGEAEAALKAADRADLAVELRMRVGDWRNVLELLKAGGGGDDELLRLAQNRLGDSFADSQRWAEAIPLYQAAGNSDALAEAYYVVEDYDALAALAASLPEGAPLLRNIGGKLQSVGLVEPAATALLRGGDGRAAVDVCVALHQWDRAVELAEAQALPGIEDLLNKYAEKLLAEGKHVPAVELYRKARREAESARLLAKLAAEVGDARTNPVRAKWLFVMAAMDVEKHRRRGAEAEAEAGAGGATAAGAAPAQRRAGHAVGLDALLKEDATAAAAAAAGAGAGGGGNAAAAAAATTAAAAARTLDRAWHGAEAYHFTLLAQRLLYAGDMGGAMAAALRLTLYEDVLDPRDVHALVALTAFYNRCYATSSRAFVKLENMETLAPDAREAYADLAVAIFSRARPADPLDDATNSVICAGDSCKAVIKAWATKCAACGLAFRACVATGRPLRVTGPGSGVLQCRLCKHFMSAASVAGRASCPLCHAGLAAV
jgi:WD repeat-containing protein 35